LLPGPVSELTTGHPISKLVHKPVDGRRHARFDTLEHHRLQLLSDPEGSLDTGHGIQLRNQFVPARVRATISQNDQSQDETRSNLLRNKAPNRWPTWVLIGGSGTRV
jgi:hypothetical protein